MVTDGLSSTAAMSERTLGLGAGQPFDASRDVWFSDARSIGFDAVIRPADDVLDLCRLGHEYVGQNIFKFSGHNYRDVNDLMTNYNHVLPPNSTVPDCSVNSAPEFAPDHWFNEVEFSSAVAARSLHRDRSVSVLLLDGSVRSVGPDVSLQIWRSLGTAADSD
jgi:hypothetical protein